MSNYKNNKFNTILYTENEIEKKIEDCSKWLNNNFVSNLGVDADSEIVVIGVLNGAINFFSQLIFKLKFDFKIDFYIVESYKYNHMSIPKIIKDINIDVTNKRVIVIDTVVASGRTLEYIIENLLNKNAKKVTVVTLISKETQRKINLKIDYCCIKTNEEFVVGWGLDYKNKYRNLPYLSSYKPEES